ncbi:MAG: ABC transporter permease [Parachlamydiaceae bacterium]|nr:ABC transporter permease [Parachlamydiaceae bacterium]
MNILALKMLIGNRAALIGVIFGIFLATLLISQQSAIFLGLMNRSYRIVSDTPQANIWVIDPATQSDEKIRTIPKDRVNIVRSVPGVEWAEPFNLMQLPLSTSTGIYDIGVIYGIDDASLIGGPIKMLAGKLRDLHREGGIIIDTFSANNALAEKLPDGTLKPIKIGDEIEINHRRTVVVGISKPSRGFYPQPIIYVANSLYMKLNPAAKKHMGFILVKTNPDADVNAVIKKINLQNGLLALTKDQMTSRIKKFFLETGILINFALSVILAFIVGLSIAGQTFYMMTEHNLIYYALIKALGGSKTMILKMIALQVFVVGSIGFCLGIICTLLWGFAIKDTTLAFYFPWQLFLFTGLIVMSICLFTAGLSIRKIFAIDPKIVMGN